MRMDESLRTAYWQPVLEIDLAYDQVVNCDPKYTALLADGIINSIPAGSIYFGGTDPGRGVPTAFSNRSRRRSFLHADPERPGRRHLPGLSAGHVRREDLHAHRGRLPALFSGIHDRCATPNRRSTSSSPVRT